MIHSTFEFHYVIDSIDRNDFSPFACQAKEETLADEKVSHCERFSVSSAKEASEGRDIN